MVAESSPTTVSARTEPDTTWYVSTSVSAGISSSNPSTVPSGRALNASSVGANTVNGPGPDNVSTKSAAPRAATRVVNRPSSTAMSTTLGTAMLISDDVSDMDDEVS